MSAVEYERIGKSYGNVRIMEEVSFRIEEGRFVVLLGPSGCGKTTLLRMTAGLEKIGAGEIRFWDQRINEVHPRDRDIAMVFQSYALYPQMKVYDNIAFGLQVRKQPKALIDERVKEAADILDLSPYLDRYPKALSGGQRQRVAMGRALVRHPRVFLFDEPLSNLDAKLRAQMRYEIRRIHDRLDTTTVYVTHDQIEAMTMADDIVVMRGGNIEQMGTPDDIYDRPVNTFVADFIGSPAINFLDGTVHRGGGSLTVRVGDQSLPLADDVDVADGHEVTVGIRPLDMELDPDSPVKGSLEAIENTGADRHVHLRFAGGQVRLVTRERIAAERGTALGLRIPPGVLHLFDRAGGQRLD